MPTTSVNSIEIVYETFGQPGDPSLVLIMGLGEQMVAWPVEFCRMLADNGFYVIRFDNRDTGLSTKFDACGLPDLNGAWDAYFKAAPITPPYSLQDMAADVNGLLESLNIEKAFVCGFSLGGMIAQNMAFKFAKRMAGLICMGSSTGERHLPPPRAEAQQTMATPPPQSRDGYIEHAVSVFQIFAGGSPLYEARCRAEIAAMTYDRQFYPIGFIRQSVAMLADGSRRERLEKVRLPTLVLHGELDPLAQPEHGMAIADALAGAQFILVPEWGHGLDYPQLWPKIVEQLVHFRASHQF
jgi:pimeloyl-ACP methyl ester carboxylesterase